MMQRLDAWSGGRPAMAALAAASALATAVVIAAGTTPSSAQVAALAAAGEHARATRDVIAAGELASRRAVAPTIVPAAAAQDSPTGGGSGSGGSSGAPAAASPATPATPATPVTPAPAASTTPSSPSPSSTPTAAPSLGHVFEIVVSAVDYASAFGSDSQLPYLRSLVSKGTLLSRYSSLGQGELADELALVGGQPPNADTSAGCPTYAEFPTGSSPDGHGVVSAAGCVYPETVLSIGDQVTSSGRTWRAYVEGMGASACEHPNSGAADDTVLPGAGSTYDTRSNPFIYFHSLLDLGDCASDDVDLGGLQHGLRATSKAPAFTFIAPGVCEATATPASDPGAAPSSSASSSTTTSTTATTSTTTTTSTSTTSTTPTTPASASPPACPAGVPTGPAATDAFLGQWVPRVLASPAYRSKGALLITVAAATAQSHPVRTGALVISPLASRGRVLRAALTPYAVLRGIETALGYTPLAEAKTASKAMSAVFR